MAERRTNPVAGFGNYSVRAAGSDDWRALRDIRLRALKQDPDMFGSNYGRELAFADTEWRRRAATSESGLESRWFAAVCGDGQWVGMAFARSAEGAATLYGMWVAPEVRGSGVAGALCDACARWARERGHSEIVLGVYDDNPRAIAAYKKAGFVAFATEPQEGCYRTSSLLMRRFTS